MRRDSDDPTVTTTASAGKDGSRGLPISVPAMHAELFARLLDAEHMLGVFQRELTPLSATPLRIASCRVKPGRSGKAVRKGRLEVVYTLGIEREDEAPKEYVLLGISPVDGGFPGPELERQARRLQGHPAVEPFRELVVPIPELQLGLLFLPLDPSLPGMAEITGPRGGRLLEPFLVECREGAKIDRLECELRHHKPFNRAVLRVRAKLAGRRGADERVVYAKAFENERGADYHAELVSLWAVAQRSEFLRVPEPLGYDPEQRLLLMSEAIGERHLSDWVGCIKKGQPPPAGLDPDRIDRCLFVAAHALRELQASGLRPQVRTFRDQLAYVAKDCPRMLAHVDDGHAALRKRVEALVSRLESLAPDDEPLAPSHGEFRHQQLVGDERTLTLIDWDGFCLANPAADASRMLARLHKDWLTHPGTPLLERMLATFRREFLAAVPGAADDLPLYEGLDLTKQVLYSIGRPSRGDDMALHARLLATAAEERLERVA